MSQRDSKGRFTKARPFQKGDRVKIRSGLQSLSPNEVGEIRDVYAGGARARVWWPEWRGGTEAPAEDTDLLILVNPAPQPKAKSRDFQVGDRVERINYPNSGAYEIPIGATGTVGVEPRGVKHPMGPGMTWVCWDILADNPSALKIMAPSITKNLRLLEPAHQPKAEDPGHVQFIESELEDARAEITSLKAELERRTNSRDGWALDATTSKRRMEVAEAKLADIAAFFRVHKILGGKGVASVADAVQIILDGAA